MKFIQATSVIAALATLTSAVPTEHVKRAFDCAGPYLIAARGSGEPKGEGVLAEVVGKITGNFAHWKGSSVGLDYPALVNNNMGNYKPSVQAGINNLTTLITSYVGQCGSNSSIVLLGYSQGAQVVSATLGGGEDEPALSSTYMKNIKAAVVFGDPTFIAGQSYDVGNATKNGVIPFDGPSPAALAPYKNVYRSYCIDNDKYCASGTSLDIHHEEVQTFANTAAKFVIFLLRAGGIS